MADAAKLIKQVTELMAGSGSPLGLQMATVLWHCAGCHERCPGIVACASRVGEPEA